jgi:Tol biopolymer transport system component
VKRRLLAAALLTILCAGCGAEAPGGAAPEPCVERTEAVPIHNWAPAWSPDGTKLAFTSGGRPQGDGTYLIDLETCAVDYVGEAIHAAWSPDGKRFAFEDEVRGGDADYRIFVAGVDGSGRRQITDGDPRQPSFDEAPDWSTTGRIVFVRNIHADEEVGSATESQVVSVRPDGTDVQVLARDEILTSPVWSPDGRQIAWACETGIALCVMSADGSNKRQAARALLGVHVQEVAWSPDGETIVFSGTRGEGSVTLFRVPARGGEPTILSPDADKGSDPAWSPDGHWIAFNKDTALGSDLYLIRPDGTGLRRLTEPGNPK